MCQALLDLELKKVDKISAGRINKWTNIFPFSQYSLIAYYVLDIVLGIVDTAVKLTKSICSCHGESYLYIGWPEKIFSKKELSELTTNQRKSWDQTAGADDLNELTVFDVHWFVVFWDEKIKEYITGSIFQLMGALVGKFYGSSWIVKRGQFEEIKI